MKFDINYLKNELGKKYPAFIKKFYKVKIENGNPFSFFEYKDVCIISADNIKLKEEYQKFLKELSLNYSELKISDVEKFNL